MPSAEGTCAMAVATAVLSADRTFTVAVKVTDWPETEGLAGLLSEVVVTSGVSPAVREARTGLPLRPLQTITLILGQPVHGVLVPNLHGASATMLATVRVASDPVPC